MLGNLFLKVFFLNKDYKFKINIILIKFNSSIIKNKIIFYLFEIFFNSIYIILVKFYSSPTKKKYF